MPRPRRPKLKAPEPLESVLARAGEDRFARRRLPIPRRVWVECVGGRIADRAEPVFLDRGVLVVRAATSTWANELSLLREPLLARLRAAGVEVHEIRFRVGAVTAPAAPPEPRITRKVPAPARLSEELDRAIEGIADDELRESLKEAARANLAWQENVTAEPAPPSQRSAASRSNPSKR
jgi:hypothetical protein